MAYISNFAPPLKQKHTEIPFNFFVWTTPTYQHRRFQFVLLQKHNRQEHFKTEMIYMVMSTA